jgi:DNA topoisomerase-1
MILIIVESPTKARSIAQYARGAFAGEDVVVRACLGHLRDLPSVRLGVDIKNGFVPEYEILLDKQKVVSTLRSVVRQAERVILASDPDREGEAVAWHIVKIFERELAGKLVERVVFHSITKESVQKGLNHPRPLDRQMVKAAIARRVADRLVGYTISPRLWQSVEGKYLSAGRVQSTALGILIRHEEKQAGWAVEIEI